MSGEIEGSSLGVLGRGGTKVGTLLQEPSKCSVQDLLRNFVLFISKAVVSCEVAHPLCGVLLLLLFSALNFHQKN